MKYDNKMIKLDDISKEARTILVEAIPYQGGASKELTKLFLDFQKETNRKYLGNEGDGSFNRFQVAVELMKRKLTTLTYKQDGSGIDCLYKAAL